MVGIMGEQVEVMEKEGVVLGERKGWYWWKGRGVIGERKEWYWGKEGVVLGERKG